MIGSEARVYYAHRANAEEERERKDGKARKVGRERRETRASGRGSADGRGNANSLATRSNGRERDEDAAKTNENG